MEDISDMLASSSKQLTIGASSSSSPSQRKYDVFLSFSGEDTRKGFTGHLYSCLRDRGVITFRDDPKLEKGTNIAPELLKAIAESWCSIIVFSKKYASSSWCLDEVVEILKQREERGHKVFPVFYDVEPCELRKPTGSVQSAFAEHEKRYNQEETQRWRDALYEASCITGWELKDRYEPEVIQEIVRKMLVELYQTRLSIPTNLVGMDPRLFDLLCKIDFGKHDVRIVGICGMGGIGKTTLARVVFTQMPGDFEAKCFLSKVGEVSKQSGLVTLQKQFLSDIHPGEEFPFSSDPVLNEVTIIRQICHKKVLLVIDDADDLEQLNCLAKERSWFGSGSKIIITSRDEHLFEAYGVDEVYKPTTLDKSEALQLLSLKAFKSDTPKNGFRSLCESVVEYAGGHPLALEVLGSFLCSRGEVEWQSAIKRLETEPEEKIYNCLRISFNGLKETEKDIFLDIAHFFIGHKRDFVTKILDACNYYSGIGLDVLIKKSLITVDEYNLIWMHDLLQEMGKHIVQQENLDEPGKRSRLSEQSDVHEVLTENSATKAIKGIVINNNITRWDQNENLTFSGDCFLKMTNLRLLIVRGYFRTCDLKYLSKELPKKLRVFVWEECCLESLPWINFPPENLVALVLPNSSLKQLWEESRPLNKLKFVNLQLSENLLKIPDFTKAKNLESLELDGCTSLVDVHPSIAFLPKLKVLNLSDCLSLKSLPNSIRMKSLKELNLCGCEELQSFPEIDGKMECLWSLQLQGTSIQELPSSIGKLSSLEFLLFSGHEGSPISSLKLPPLSGLTSLAQLDLSYRNLYEGTLPSDICDLPSLQILQLAGNYFVSLPANLFRLTKLQYLILSGCESLRTLPELPPSIIGVGIESCTSLEKVAIPTKAYMTPWTQRELDSLEFFYELPNYNGVNCYKLAANGNALRMFKAHLKAFSEGRDTFDIVLPGSKIYKWFTYQCEGYEVCEGSEECKDVIMLISGPKRDVSVWVPLPPNLVNDSDWMGIALCCVVWPNFWEENTSKVFVDVNPTGCGPSSVGIDHIGYIGFKCVYEYQWTEGYSDDFENKYKGANMFGDHIWLLYMRRTIVEECLRDTPGCTGFQIRFSVVWPSVKKCGARLVYRNDTEDPNI